MRRRGKDRKWTDKERGNRGESEELKMKKEGEEEGEEEGERRETKAGPGIVE